MKNARKINALIMAAALVFNTVVLSFASFAAPVFVSGPSYVKDNYSTTDSLSESDKNDYFQKNYVSDADSVNPDNYYLYKSAEWIDQKAGTARITLLGKAPAVSVTESRAVYIVETCTAHTFTKSIAKDNILWLLTKYDHLDVVIDNGCTWDDMLMFTDVTDASCLDSAYWDGQRHSSDWEYACLVKYLMGDNSSRTQIRFPSAIYVSEDNICLSTGTVFHESSSGRYTSYADSMSYNNSVWPILQKYESDSRYFVMGPNTNTQEYLINAARDTSLAHFILSANTAVGLVSPNKYWMGMEADHIYSNPTIHETTSTYGNYITGVHITGVNYEYFYGTTFNNEATPTAPPQPFSITDTVSADYDITSYTCSEAASAIAVNGNEITASIPSYTGTAVTVTIDIKLKDPDMSMSDWQDTNAGNATMLCGSEYYKAVSSPKLYKPEKVTPPVATSSDAVYVHKNWSSSIHPDSAQFQLYVRNPDGSVTALNSTKTADASNNWTVNWTADEITALPATPSEATPSEASPSEASYDADGALYDDIAHGISNYYVQEINIPIGWNVTYSDPTITTENGATIVVYEVMNRRTSGSSSSSGGSSHSSATTTPGGTYIPDSIVPLGSGSASPVIDNELPKTMDNSHSNIAVLLLISLITCCSSFILYRRKLKE